MRRFRLPLSLLLAVCLVVPVLLLPTGTRAADAILDAKRKAAAQLLRDGKATEAISMMNEVLLTDENQYADHLLMAHAYEKRGDMASALKHYRRVLALLPGAPSDQAERQARIEADKRCKAIDPVTPKIEAVVEEFQHKLDGLEKDAIAAKSMVAMTQIFKLRGAVIKAGGDKTRQFVEVLNNTAWQSGGKVLAGHRYRIRAAGTWSAAGATECTASGIPTKPNEYGHVGNLIVRVATPTVGGNIVAVNEDLVLTPQLSGELMFMSNLTTEERIKSTGSISVLVEGE